METAVSKELHFRDLESIALLFERYRIAFRTHFVTFRNEIFRKGILLQMARHRFLQRHRKSKLPPCGEFQSRMNLVMEIRNMMPF